MCLDLATVGALACNLLARGSVAEEKKHKNTYSVSLEKLFRRWPECYKLLPATTLDHNPNILAGEVKTRNMSTRGVQIDKFV